ncbi:MAG: peroxidase-related enzyme [Chromatiaceae bacterium]|nr:peroxidase-related enzyme [Chromatiaceae bacterium]MCF7996219.1 peroxidase-related enzyme [Chromatiaceae bacterium]
MNQRLPLIEPQVADAKVAALYRQIDARFGGVPNLFKALAHKPGILEATLAKIARVMDEGELERRLKEMMAVVVADARGCAYCVGAHSMALQRLGVPQETIGRLLQDLDAAPLPADWIELLQLARRAAADVHAITDADIARLWSLGLSDAAVVELASVIELFIALSFFLDLFAVPLDEPPTANANPS